MKDVRLAVIEFFTAKDEQKVIQKLVKTPEEMIDIIKAIESKGNTVIEFEAFSKLDLMDDDEDKDVNAFLDDESCPKCGRFLFTTYGHSTCYHCKDYQHA